MTAINQAMTARAAGVKSQLIFLGLIILITGFSLVAHSENPQPPSSADSQSDCPDLKNFGCGNIKDNFPGHKSSDVKCISQNQIVDGLQGLVPKSMKSKNACLALAVCAPTEDLAKSDEQKWQEALILPRNSKESQAGSGSQRPSLSDLEDLFKPGKSFGTKQSGDLGQQLKNVIESRIKIALLEERKVQCRHLPALDEEVISSAVQALEVKVAMDIGWDYTMATDLDKQADRKLKCMEPKDLGRVIDAQAGFYLKDNLATICNPQAAKAPASSPGFRH
ncbi:MAG: hypothetical protein C5B49_05655 [Bdellovibrio sp.]|nr:MAG: hypothetical protein C5B49_05655 [Bdellovibrio sp.]